MDAIAQYAGADAETAKLHEQDRALLTSADPKAVHYVLAFSDLRDV